MTQGLPSALEELRARCFVGVQTLTTLENDIEIVYELPGNADKTRTSTSSCFGKAVISPIQSSIKHLPISVPTSSASTTRIPVISNISISQD